MDWLEAMALFLLGWMGKKLKRFARATLDTIWTLVWCTSTFRCMLVAIIYTAFLKVATSLRKDGQLRGAPLRATARFIAWASPKMDAWIERTGPGTPSWDATLAQLAHNRARHDRQAS